MDKNSKSLKIDRKSDKVERIDEFVNIVLEMLEKYGVAVEETAE